MPFDATGHPKFSKNAILFALRATRDGIANAWCQERWTDGHGFCAFAWLRQVTNSYTQNDIAAYIMTNILEPIIQEQCGHYVSLSSFNDTRTQSEIIALFDVAIERVDDPCNSHAEILNLEFNYV